MHDIRFIRDNPAFVRRRPEEAQPGAARRRAAGDRQAPPRRHLRERGGPGQAQGAQPPDRHRQGQGRADRGADGGGRRPRGEPEEGRGRGPSARRGADASPGSAAQPAVRRRARRHRRDRQRRDPPGGQSAQLRLPAQGPCRSRRSDGRDGLCRRGQDLRCPLRVPQGPAGAARAGDRAVHARPAHQRGGRLHRGQSALAGARQCRLRRRPAAEIRRGHVPYRQRLLADSDRRGAAHQPGERHGRSTRSSCRCASPPGRRASAPRRARPARTRAA